MSRLQTSTPAIGADAHAPESIMNDGALLTCSRVWTLVHHELLHCQPGSCPLSLQIRHSVLPPKLSRIVHRQTRSFSLSSALHYIH